MSRFGQWLRRDLSKVNKPGEIGRTVRRYPVIMVVFAVNLVAALLVIYGVLALFGHTDAFGDFAIGAFLWAGSSGGRMVHRRKSEAAPPADLSAPDRTTDPPITR